MDVSVGMVVDRARLLGVEVLSAPTSDARFPNVALASLADERTLLERWLHLADEADAAAFLKAHPQAFLLCRCAGPLVPSALRPFEGRVLFVQGAAGVEDLYMQLRDYFALLGRWEYDVRNALLEDKGYQDILDLSEPVLGNFVSVSDSSFRLIAYTKNTPVDDPVTCSLIRLGGHDPATIRTFEELNLVESWREDPRYLEVCEDSPICIYPTIAHAFRFRQSYFVHVVMLCNHRPLTRGLKDLFRCFVELLEHCVRRDWALRRRFSQPHDRLFADLALGSPLGESDLKAQAGALGLPSQGAFALCVVDVDRADSFGIEQIAWQLAKQFPSCWVSLVEGRIVILSADADAAAGPRTWPSRPAVRFVQQSFLSAMKVFVGVSCGFDTLGQMPHAYRQALFALRGGAFAAAEDAAAMRTFYFSDCLCSYLLDANERSAALDRYCLEQHPLGLIAAEDRAHHTDNAHVLLTYLACERRVTMAAGLLHLHRNSVVYRIERLEKAYGFDLADANVRFEFLLVGKAMETLLPS